MNKCATFLICFVSLFFSSVNISQAEPSATVSVNPPSYQGKCPVTVMVDANITATSAGNIAIKATFWTRRLFGALQRLNKGRDRNIWKAKIIVGLRPVTNLTAQRIFLTMHNIQDTIKLEGNKPTGRSVNEFL